jgi:hypothetical protein
MTTPILPMIPKTIVALGESTDVMDRGCGIDVELGSVETTWLVRMLGKEGMVVRRFDKECNR